jgi:glycine/D-amino acid oxidase-like deaminating enzyme
MSDAGAVAVVGGGVVGLSCALHLRQLGANVTVFDEGASTPSASTGNAGHIAIEQVEPLASPSAMRSAIGRLFIAGGAVDFRLSDARAWAPWALSYVRASTTEGFAAGRGALNRLLADAIPAWRRLASSIEQPDLLKEAGHLVLWESANSARSGLRSWSKADTGLAVFEALDETSLAQVAGHLKSPLGGGIRFSGTAQIRDLGCLLRGLRCSLKRDGVKFERDTATAIRVLKGRASLHLRAQEPALWDLIVVAAGVGSGALMRSAGHCAPIIAERGYHIEAQVAGDWPDLPPIVFEDRSIIVTRFGDRLRAASFVEFGRSDSPPDNKKWTRLRRHVHELGLPMREPFAQWMGSRPTLPDYLPAIGVSSRAENLIYAFGHQHLGLTLAPTTGEIVAQLAAGKFPAIDIAPFDIGRFEASSAKVLTSATVTA